MDRFEVTLTYRPGSKNTKPDALSLQYSGEQEIRESEPILAPGCVIGQVAWAVKRRDREVSQETPIPAGGPPGRLYVPETVRAEVLDWGHASRLA